VDRQQEPELERFKRRLLRELLNQNTNPELTAPLRRAANEAAALAWLTPYPLLVFPALLEEKVQRAQQHSLRQARIRRRSRKLLPGAVNPEVVGGSAGFSPLRRLDGIDAEIP